MQATTDFNIMANIMATIIAVFTALPVTARSWFEATSR